MKNEQISQEEAKVPENFEISINYVHNRKKLDRNKVIINNIFAFQMELDIDDAFFNQNWAGARRGRWAGPRLLAGWGCRLLDRRGWGRITAAMLDCGLWV